MALLVVCSMWLTAGEARAESAVDDLTIRVGYTGMDLNRYVSAGTWNWAKLYHELPMDSRAYSYFQSPAASDNPSSDTLSSKTYNAIVDSANGFYITDLLDYAGLYTSDIYNIGFYVTDHGTIWTAFDTSALFESRYYFNNLPSHRVETEEGYDFSDAWNDCETVAPMLAIEDNWASYTERFESIGPDFTDVKPGNRFHLMFGQTSPTQQLTRESAKYIDCLYVTLRGKPEFSANEVQLDGTMGSHTAKMKSRVDNETVMKQVADLLDLKSTNESVLKIKNVTVVRDEDYSDLATVVIDYDIVGKGEASITGSFGGSDEYQFQTAVVQGGTDQKQQESAAKEKEKTKKQTATDKKKQKTAANNKQKTATTGNGQGSVSVQTGGNGDRTNPTDQQASRADATAKANTVTGVFKLSGKVHDQLQGTAAAQKAEASPTEDVTQLKVYRDKAKEKQDERLRGLIAALGSIGIMGVGAAWEGASFRMRLKKRRA